MNKLNSTFVASLTWIMKDSLGDELDVLDEPVEFLVGGDDLLPPIDKALLDKPREQLLGQKIKLYIEPEQGFGDFNDLVRPRPRCQCSGRQVQICVIDDDHQTFHYT